MNENFENQKKPDLTIKGFVENILNKNVSDNTIEEMFWEIYEHDKEMAKEALECLEHSEREDLTHSIALKVLDKEKPE